MLRLSLLRPCLGVLFGALLLWGCGFRFDRFEQLEPGEVTGVLLLPTQKPAARSRFTVVGSQRQLLVDPQGRFSTILPSGGFVLSWTRDDDGDGVAEYAALRRVHIDVTTASDGRKVLSQVDLGQVQLAGTGRVQGRIDRGVAGDDVGPVTVVVYRTSADVAPGHATVSDDNATDLPSEAALTTTVGDAFTLPGIIPGKVAVAAFATSGGAIFWGQKLVEVPSQNDVTVDFALQPADAVADVTLQVTGLASDVELQFLGPTRTTRTASVPASIAEPLEPGLYAIAASGTVDGRAVGGALVQQVALPGVTQWGPLLIEAQPDGDVARVCVAHADCGDIDDRLHLCDRGHCTPTTTRTPNAAPIAYSITDDVWRTFDTAPTRTVASAAAVTAAEVVVFGGLSAAGASNETWVLRAGAWSLVDTTDQIIPPPRFHHAMVALPDDTVLVAGGETFLSDNASTTTALDDIWLFSNDTWQRVGTLPAPSADLGLGVVADNNVVVVEPHARHFAARADLSTWSTQPAEVDAPVRTATDGESTYALRWAPADGPSLLQGIDSPTSSSTYTSTGPYPGRRQAASLTMDGVDAAVWLVGGDVLGGGLSDELWLFDVATGQSSRHTPLALARTDHAAATFAGQIIVVGGHEANATRRATRVYSEPSAAVAVVTPSDEVSPPFANLAFFAQCASRTTQQLLVFGGSDDNGVVNNVGYLYDGFTQTWRVTSSTVAPSPRDKSACAFRTDDNGAVDVVIFGGRDQNGQTHNDTFAYDPFTDVWQALDIASPVGGRLHHALAAIGSAVYLAGGIDDDGVETNVVERLDAGGWTRLTGPLITPFHGVGMSGVSGGIDAVFGLGTVDNAPQPVLFRVQGAIGSETIAPTTMDVVDDLAEARMTVLVDVTGLDHDVLCLPSGNVSLVQSDGAVVPLAATGIASHQPICQAIRDDALYLARPEAL